MPLALVFGAPAPSIRTHRTLRALSRLGLPAVHAKNAAELLAVLGAAKEEVWLLRAGAFPMAFHAPPPKSLSKKPLLALGATRSFGNEALVSGFDALMAKTGGDLRRWPAHLAISLDSLWIDEAAPLGELLRDGRSLEEAVRSLVLSRRFRAIRAHALDVRQGDRPRVLQVITTLHRGGAERLSLHLSRGLEAHGIDVLLCVLDKAARDTFDAPKSTIFLSKYGSSRGERFLGLIALARDFGADVIHTHLLEGEELSALASQTAALVINTLHNERVGWPAGISSISPQDCALLLCCSLKVEQDARAALSPAFMVRTVWNAIEAPAAQGLNQSPIRAGLRAKHAIPPNAPLLLCVANYRPQKRLEQIPELVAELKTLGIEAYAMLVGEREKSAQAALISGLLRERAQALGVDAQVIELGSELEMERFYAACDLLVSTSAHEGLSMAWLEALSLGLPLVVRDVGGALELSKKHPSQVHVVTQDASIQDFARAVCQSLQNAAIPLERRSIAPDFSCSKMSERHALLYKRALRANIHTKNQDRRSLVLVTNNFSTGGAQSSARRLLVGLSKMGIQVRAAVLQEQAQFPTPGRAALLREGIPVFSAPRAEEHDALLCARAVAAWIDESPTDALLFWNVIPEHKILLADMLLGMPVFDVSPGEMYFASLARYFSKPRVGLPYLEARDYGRLLKGVVVKYEGEAQRARDILGAPVKVIPNGIVIPTRAQIIPRPARERVVFGTLARISPDKKLEELLNAAELAGPKMPPWELRIGGAPELGYEAYAQSLRERWSHLPITWMGEVDSSSFLGELDAFVMISEPAGCPNASLEAMAQALPIAATDHGGVREQIEAGITGFLLGRGDVQGLASAMIELAHHPELCKKLGNAGYERAKNDFNLSTMVESYASLTLGR